MKERLADELADHYLDPDPTKAPSWAASARRARLALDVDPDNLKARCFLLRLYAHHAESEERQGNRNFDQLARELDTVKRHADWLAEQLPSLPDERAARAKSDLAAYYQQMGELKHAVGQKATTEANEASERFDRIIANMQTGSIMPYEARGQLISTLKARSGALETTRNAYRDSDAAYQQSLRYEPVNAQAKQRFEHHREQCAVIEKVMSDVNDMLYKMR